MSTATVLTDRPHPISEKDENTIITDYWLNFMSVRQQDENHESAPRNREIELKVEDFCRRLNTLSLERRTLVTGLERMRQDVWREFARDSRPSPSNNINGSALSQLHMAKPDQLRGPFAEPSRDSLLGRVRSSGLYLTIQKLL